MTDAGGPDGVPQADAARPVPPAPDAAGTRSRPVRAVRLDPPRGATAPSRVPRRRSLPGRPDGTSVPPGAGPPGARPGAARPGSAPDAPGGARRPPNVVGILAVASAAFVAALVTFGIFLPALGVIGDAITRDPATLPDRISACGRDWQRDPLARELTPAEIFERTEAAPVVVSPGLLTPCPAEATPDGQLVATLYVRTGPDRYVGYDLAGSP